MTLTSAADAAYGSRLLNLLGSVKRNSDIFDAVIVYDLGLTTLQRRLLGHIEGVQVRRVPEFVPHWSLCWTWKPWIWTHTDTRILIFLDAGITVLRSLEEIVQQVEDRGYFLVSQIQPNHLIVPSDYVERFELDEALLNKECVASGILGFDTRSSFFSDVVRPTFKDACAGLNLGWSRDEVSSRNVGLNRMPVVVLRDCKIFRHEQTLLSIYVYKALRSPVVNDALKYAGWRSPQEHPQQLIWSHRRTGTFDYLADIPYSSFEARALGAACRLAIRFKEFRRRNPRWVSPRAYTRRVLRMLGMSRLAARLM